MGGLRLLEIARMQFSMTQFIVGSEMYGTRHDVQTPTYRPST